VVILTGQELGLFKVEKTLGCDGFETEENRTVLGGNETWLLTVWRESVIRFFVTGC
jgi:hypothetical protein